MANSSLSLAICCWDTMDDKRHANLQKVRMRYLRLYVYPNWMDLNKSQSVCLMLQGTTAYCDLFQRVGLAFNCNNAYFESLEDVKVVII